MPNPAGQPAATPSTAAPAGSRDRHQGGLSPRSLAEVADLPDETTLRRLIAMLSPEGRTEPLERAA